MRVLVTGAARGLGYEIVKEALGRGHHIAAAVRAESDVTALNTLAAQHGGLLTVFTMDVTDAAQVDSAVVALTQQWGALDGIINNAAIMTSRFVDFDVLPLEDVRQNFDVNVVGTMRVIQKMLPLLYAGQKPVVINVSSEAGTIVNAYAGNYPYAISKTAVNMFTERLNAHFAGRDINAWAVHPGWMRTAMGGESAPVDPAVTAWGFWEIMERKAEINSKITFIDATGRPMPL